VSISSFFIYSVLDGGFVSGLRFLLKPGSTLDLSTALVDADIPAVYSLFGIAQSEEQPVENNLSAFPSSFTKLISSTITPFSRTNASSVDGKNGTSKLLTGIGTTFSYWKATSNVWKEPTNKESENMLKNFDDTSFVIESIEDADETNHNFHLANNSRKTTVSTTDAQRAQVWNLSAKSMWL
jgi:hypothetical protein